MIPVWKLESSVVSYIVAMSMEVRLPLESVLLIKKSELVVIVHSVSIESNIGDRMTRISFIELR